MIKLSIKYNNKKLFNLITFIKFSVCYIETIYIFKLKIKLFSRDILKNY